MGKTRVCAAKAYRYFQRRRTKRIKLKQQFLNINQLNNQNLGRLYLVMVHQLLDIFLQNERSIWIKPKPNQGYWNRVLEKWEDTNYPCHLRLHKQVCTVGVVTLAVTIEGMASAQTEPGTKRVINFIHSTQIQCCKLPMRLGRLAEHSLTIQPLTQDVW